MTEEVLPPNHYAPEGDAQPNYSLEQQSAAQEAGMSIEEFIKQGHDQAEGTPPADAPADDKYAGKTIEQVIEMHKEAERLISERGQPKPEETPPADQGDDKPTLDAAAVTAAIRQAAANFAQNSKLEDSDFATLAAAGVPREHAVAYIEGGLAQSELTAIKVFEVTGGEEGYNSMLTWARKHIDQSQLSQFDAVLDSGKRADIIETTSNLWARFQSDGGGPPKLISGEIAQLDGVQPFASDAEMVAAMSDPRYRSDPAYIKSVEARIAAGA